MDHNTYVTGQPQHRIVAEIFASELTTTSCTCRYKPYATMKGSLRLCAHSALCRSVPHRRAKRVR
eukprot:1578858-Prymnesium_polylepis.2